MFVHVSPSAKKSMLAGLHGDRLKIRVGAVPERGAANKMLCEYIARVLQIPTGSVSLVSGETRKQKTLAISGCTLDQAIRRLLVVLQSS